MLRPLRAVVPTILRSSVAHMNEWLSYVGTSELQTCDALFSGYIDGRKEKFIIFFVPEAYVYKQNSSSNAYILKN